ncbi:MAG: hypothetical protein PHU63_00620 [Candidatus ainarchaeum sp.]|nr:hypothetical protein [Candidatus ainarchaeum sp.]
MDYEYIRSKLEIVAVNELKHHEERVQRNLMRLKEAMLNIGQIVDPIIIDKEHKIVLDGNHRLKVLQLIKVPNVVCQVEDYNNKNIVVGGWFPTDERINKKLLEDTGAKLEKVEREQGKKELDDMKAVFMLVCKEGNYLVNPGKYSLDDVIYGQQEILGKIGNDFRYIADDSIEKEIRNGKGALFRKNYTKEEIVKRTLTGNPFPPKSTRHLIPDRIIRLNMRLGWLHQEKKEATEYLERTLKNRVYAGNVRRYVEPVIVIY